MSTILEQKIHICYAVDNFIKNPSEESLQQFKSLFGLDNRFLQNLIDKNDFESVAEDIKFFTQHSFYAQYLRDYLSATPDIKTTFINTSNNDYQDLPYSTRLAQIVHTPVIFEFFCTIYPHTSWGGVNVNQYDIENINALFFYETLSGCDIQKNKNISQYIDSDYDVLSYNLNQNAFFFTFMSKHLLLETWEVFKQREKYFLKNYLIEKIIKKNPQDLIQSDIKKIEGFLPNFKEKADAVRIQNITLNEKIDLLLPEIENLHNSLKATYNINEMKYLSYFWGYALFDFSLDFKGELLVEIMKNKNNQFKQDEKLLIDIISGFPSVSIIPRAVKFTCLMLNNRHSHIFNKVEVGAFLNAAVYHTPQNKIDKEKKYLDQQFLFTQPIELKKKIKKL